MGKLDNIEKSAEKLIVLCQKEKPTNTDKQKMLALHTEILAGIEGLTECELCGAISEVIVTMTLADVTAKLCKECGVRALDAGKIQKSTPRKRTPSTKTTAKPAPKKSDKKEEEPETPAELHARVEDQTGIKKTDVKRLQKIIAEIATPMSYEHTLTYVKREVENVKLKVEEKALEKAVELLTAA